MSEQSSTPENDPSVLNYQTVIQPEMHIPAVRVGKYIAIATKAALPARCVLCNAKAEGPASSITLDDASFVVFIPGAGPRFVLVYYCAQHRKFRSKCYLAAFTLAVLGIAMIFFLSSRARTSHSDGMLIIVGISTWMVWLAMGIVLFVGTRGPRFRYRRHGYVYLSGCGMAFIESIPSAPEMPNRRNP
jgi:hypothetical protein